MNRVMTATINGRSFKVHYLNGAVWYVEMTIASGLTRTTWHRDSGRPIAGMTLLAVQNAA